MTQEGSADRARAEQLALGIRHYWKTRGQLPRVWVQQEVFHDSFGKSRVTWVVRSDIKFGRPDRDRLDCGRR